LISMRYTIIAIFFSLITQFSAASVPDIETNMNIISSFENRSDGTDGERKTIEFIVEQLKKLNISFEYQNLDSEKQGHSFAQNVIAEIPGDSPGRFIIAAPIDGGAFSIALLLELAEKFNEHSPENTVILAFLGAEQGNSVFHPYGSRIAAKSLSRKKNIFTIYISSEDSPREWELKIGGKGKVAPYWFTRKLSTVLSSNLINYKLRGSDIQAARLNLQGDTGPLQTWIDKDIPTILFQGYGKIEENEKERQTIHIINSIINLDKELKTIPATHSNIYLFIRPFQWVLPRIISELPYVFVLLAISASILSIILLRFRDVKLNLRRFTRYWWSWPLLFMIVFLFFFISTLIVEETLLLADFPGIWTYAPGIFVFFKISIAAALSLNFILITRGLPLPRSPHFYSYAAIITAGLASLVFTAIDITLSAYSLWTIINLMLFTATRKISRKGFFLLLSIVPTFMGLLVIIGEPYSAIINSLLLSRISGSLVLTLVIFPIILAFTSLSYWRHHYDRTRYSFLTPAATLTLTLSSIITLFWILGYNPYTVEFPQPIKIIDYINLNNEDRKLEISSPGPIGNVTLHLDGKEYSLEQLNRTADVRMPFNRIPIEIESESRSFLGRRTITGTIAGESNPESLVLHLNSTKPFTLHEANFPYEMAPSGTSAQVFIGDNPPFPISFKFTVNNDAQLILSVIGNWSNPDNPPHINRPDVKDKAIRTALLEVSI